MSMVPTKRKAPEGPRAADTAAQPFDCVHPTEDRGQLDPTAPDYYARLIDVYRPLLDMDRRRRTSARRRPPLDDGRRDPLGAVSDGQWP